VERQLGTTLETMTDGASIYRTAAHWGAYDASVVDGRLTALQPISSDPDPSPIGPGMVQAINDVVRIREPMIRKDWLEMGPAKRAGGRGRGPFLAVSWERALDLVAGEIDRIRDAFGNEAIFAGSYGWASAGRFHHALSQIHRFMAMAGGYTDSRDTYSLAAADVVLPHILGIDMWQFMGQATSFETIIEHGELVVMFGGIPMKNAQVEGGGTGRHWLADALRAARDRGVEFVNIGPNRADAADYLDAEWLACRPSTDTAVMLGLAHTLVAEDLHDSEFVRRCTVGFERFSDYLMGAADGMPKDADWAAAITGIEPDTIRTLARRMAAARTMLNLSWSVQRVDHGEQSFWSGVALAALIGQVGLPGGGISFGYGAVNTIGRGPWRIPRPTLPGAPNPVATFIPVARIADMLLNPGAEIDYDGQRLSYPEVRMVYWAGGNPSTIIKTLTAWSKPGSVPKRWSCMSPGGTPPRDMPISCFPSRQRWSVTISAARAATITSSLCSGRLRLSASHAPTIRSSPTLPRGWALLNASPRAGTKESGCAISTTGFGRAPPSTGSKRRHSTTSGKRARSRRPGRRLRCYSIGFATIPRRTRSKRRRAASSSSPTRSRASAMTTAEAILFGWNPPSGWARRRPSGFRCTSSLTNRRPVCTASMTMAAIARARKLMAASRSSSILLVRTPATSRTAIW